MENNEKRMLSYEEATGIIDYTLTNDYMFRAILQTNELVLRGLISSLLHLEFEKINTVKVENPIKLGKAINNKNFILDIRVLLNDKFILNVLSLKQIELATEEDKTWQIDLWAKLFTAKTWRDIKMIAKTNEIFASVSESLYQFNSDDLVREQCEARMEYERHERTIQKKLAGRE